ISPVAENTRAALSLAAEIKHGRPDTVVLLGGHHATNCRADILGNEPQIDAIILGDGERTFANLLSDFPRLDGNEHLATRENLGSGNRPYQELDLDRLPWPYRPELGSQDYGDQARMVTTRGCPFRCAFCTTPGIYDRV